MGYQYAIDTLAEKMREHKNRADVYRTRVKSLRFNPVAHDEAVQNVNDQTEKAEELKQAIEILRKGKK